MPIKKNIELTQEEFKKLVCDLAIKITPVLLENKIKENNNNIDLEAFIACLSYDIADAIKVVLNDRFNAKF
ncbi:hypothetical protein PG357_07760 [Riemerella anatipestifer]|nr:hypothetical protein [Riemerella anatipestifer]